MYRRIIILAVLGFLLGGCAPKTTVLDVGKPIHLSAKYGHADLKAITEKMVSSIVTNPPVAQRQDRPVAIIYGIENRTSEHIDTKIIEEKIRTSLVQTRKLRFINKEQRKSIEQEIKYQQGGMVTSATRIKLGKQIGAEYMISGALSSIKEEEPRGIRFYETFIRYYKLNLELTDLNTGLIEWSDEKEFAREMDKPIIGW